MVDSNASRRVPRTGYSHQPQAKPLPQSSGTLSLAQEIAPAPTSRHPCSVVQLSKQSVAPPQNSVQSAEPPHESEQPSASLQ